MDIILELKNLWVLVIPYLGVLFSFLLGAGFTIVYTYLQRKQQSKKLRTLYLKWYELSKSSITNQVNFLKNYIIEINQNSIGSTNLKLNNIRFEVLSTFEYEKLFQAFVYDRRGNQEENAKQIFLLTGNIQYLIVAMNSIKAKYEKSQIHYQDWQGRFNEAIRNFHELIFNYYFQYKDDMDLYVDRITNIKEGFKEKYDINTPTDKVISELVKPIEEVIHDHLFFEKNSILLKDIKRKTQELQFLEQEKIQMTISTENILNQYIQSIEKALHSSDRNHAYFSKNRYDFIAKFKNRFSKNTALKIWNRLKT